MPAAPAAEPVPEVVAAVPAMPSVPAPVAAEPVSGGNVCPGCGASLVEGSLFCTACGTKVTPPAAPVYEEPQKSEPKKGLFSNKLLLLGATGVLVVISLVLIFCLAFGGDNPESVAVEAVEAAYEGDVETMIDLLPATFPEEYSDEIGDLAEELEEAYEYRMDELFDEYGDVDITVEAVYVQEFTKKQLRSKAERYEEDFNLVLEDAAEVMLLVVTESSTGEEGDIIEMEVVKIDGDWCLDIYEID
jgi:hypothetical protein